MGTPASGAAAGTNRHFSRGELLFEQGDGAGSLFVIKEGSVKVYKTEGGVDVELDIVQAGGVVGEISVIDGGKRSASVKAAEDVEALEISPDAFRAIVTKMPEWFYKIARILSKRLREVDGKIDSTVGGDKLPHVAWLLSQFACSPRWADGEKGRELNRKFVENELLDILPLSVADVSDILERLHKRKLCMLDRGKVIVPNREALVAAGETVFGTQEEMEVAT